jgi:hypothetical protein
MSKVNLTEHQSDSFQAKIQIASTVKKEKNLNEKGTEIQGQAQEGILRNYD